MEYIIIFAVIIAIFIYLVIKQRISNKREKINRIKASFGSLGMGDCEASELGKLKNILKYYDNLISPATYDDFNMDEVFLKLDDTCSAIGEEYLYTALHNPNISKEVLENRKVLSEELAGLDETLELRYQLLNIKKYKRVTVLDCIHRLKDLEVKGTVFNLACFIAFIISFILMFVMPSIGVFTCILVAAFNAITYVSKKSQVEEYVSMVMLLIMMLDTAEKLSPAIINKPQANNANQLLERINNSAKKFSKIKQGAWAIAPRSSVESIVEILLDYLKFVTHIDIIKFNFVINKLKQYDEEYIELYNLIGELELALNIASNKAALGQYCIPEFTDEVKIEADEMYHLLIDKPVANACNTAKSMLITGSNASGKSTYLRMLGLNAILAQTLCYACAKSYKAPLFTITSSMRITDSILDGESFYMAEIRHIKEILELESSRPVLVCIDEILRGTNTLERVSASSQILKHMSAGNCLVLAATHDVELIELLKGIYDNYYFCENIDDSDSIFDYKIRQGVNYTNNAIKLLDRCGYPKAIVEDSYKVCEELRKVKQ